VQEMCTLDRGLAHFSLASGASISDNPALIDCSGARAEEILEAARRAVRGKREVRREMTPNY